MRDNPNGNAGPVGSAAGKYRPGSANMAAQAGKIATAGRFNPPPEAD
jgi:hypothetical protein